MQTSAIDTKLEEYLLLHGINSKKRHGKLWFSCIYPDHTDINPSMTIIPGRNIMKCFGCGRTLSIQQAFDIFNPSKAELSYSDKEELIAQELGIRLPTKYNASDIAKMYEAYRTFEAYAIDGKRKVSSSAFSYLHSKNIDISCDDIGYIPDYAEYEKLMLSKYQFDMLKDISLIGNFRFSPDSVVFFLRDEFGHPVASASRYTGTDTNEPKYINSSNSPIYIKSNMLFGMHKVKSAERIIVVEGYSDALVAWNNGLTDTVALSGTSMSLKQALWIKSHASKGAILALDGDDAGQIGMIKIAKSYFADPQDIHLAFCSLPDGKDPDDVILADGSKAMFANMIDRVKIFYTIMKADKASDDEISNYIAQILVNSDDSTARRYMRTYAAILNKSYSDTLKYIKPIMLKHISDTLNGYEQIQHSISNETVKLQEKARDIVNLYTNVGGDLYEREYQGAK